MPGTSSLSLGPGSVIGKMKHTGQGLMPLNCNFKVIELPSSWGCMEKLKSPRISVVKLNKE